jgi:hypothetical protein
VDDDPAIRVYFDQRLVEAVVPASRRNRLLMVPGRAEDIAAGIPTERADPLSREVVEDLFRQAEPALDAGAPVLALREFDSTAYFTVLLSGGPIFGNDVAVVRGAPLDPVLAATLPGRFAALPRGPALLLQGLGAILLLGLAGAGWARLAFPQAPSLVWTGLAPAFGAAVIALLSLVAVHAGLTLGQTGGRLVVAVSVGSSVGVLVRSGRRGTSAGLAHRPA